MKYLATFYTHYGAILFHRYCKKKRIPAKMMPVPRKLSSSCGVCVQLEAASAPNAEEHEDMECCYAVEEDGIYKPVK